MRTLFGLFETAPELETPSEVASDFDPALESRRARYIELKESTATLIYWRERTKAEIDARRLAVARLHDAARIFAQSGDEPSALAALDEKHRMLEEIERAEDERAEIGQDVADAKERLLLLGREIEALDRERSLAIARYAAVKARQRLARITSDDRTEAALAKARERIANAVAEREIAALEAEPRDRTAAALELAVLKKRRTL